MQTSTPILRDNQTGADKNPASLVSYLISLREKQAKQKLKLQESINQSKGDEESFPVQSVDQMDKENFPPSSNQQEESPTNVDHNIRPPLQSEENREVPKFPFLKKGHGTGRFNYRKKLKLKKKTNENRNDEREMLHLLKPEVRELPSPIVPDKLSDTETFEALEKLTEDYSICSTSSVVNRIFRGEDKLRGLVDNNANADTSHKQTRNVQFCERGAQVLEYPQSEEETLLENSTELNLSEIEYLATNNRQEQSSGSNLQSTSLFSQFFRKMAHNELSTSTPDKKSNLKKPQHFQPATSRGNDSTKGTPSGCDQRNDDVKDVAAQKVLLVSKVEELNKEIKTFQKENEQLHQLKTLFEHEKQLWDKERATLEDSLHRDRAKLHKHLETETNKLHQMKNEVRVLNPLVDNQNTLEIINLKEEIIKLKRDNSEKDSKFLQAQKKWKQRIFELKEENEGMKEMVDKVTLLKKENIDLKHQVDRLKLASKTKSNFSSPTLQGQSAKVLKKHSATTAVENTPIKNTDISTENISVTTENGSTVVKYANGNKKTVFLSGVVLYEYYNGDNKEVHEDREVYTYASDQTVHTLYSDGTEELEYSYGQREVTKPDGSKEITYPDKSVRSFQRDGTQVYRSLDGTVVYSLQNGEKVLELSSGQLEYHGPDFKKREYPDGTVKISYTDGRVETIYPDGKVKLKKKL